MIQLIKPDKSSFVWIHRIIDLIIPLGIILLLLPFFNVIWHERYVFLGLLGGFVFVFMALQFGVYRNWRGRALFASIKLIVLAWLLSWASLIILVFLLKDSASFSRLTLTTWALATPVFLIGYRFLIRYFLGKFSALGNQHKTVAVVGAGLVGQHIADVLNKNPWLGCKVVAFFDDNTELHGHKINNIETMGGTDQIVDIVNANKFNEIYICLPMRAEPKIKQILDDLTDTTAIVKFVPDLFAFDLMHSQWSDLGGVPVFSVYDSPLNTFFNRSIKRMEDIVLSSIIITITSPLMILLSIGVKLSSPGPIFYKQTRIGWNGKNFQMIKFRSMPQNAESNSVIWGNASQKTTSKFGQFIRKTSMDELPQFFNVLLGHMSIVGPRPERDIFVDEFRKQVPRYMQKHMVKAGITGWAQVNGWRGDTCLNKRIEFDLHYINSWSLMLDIKIIILTALKGLVHNDSKKSS